MSRMTRAQKFNNWGSDGETYRNNVVEMEPRPEEMDIAQATSDAPEEPKARPFQKIGADGKVIKRKPNPKRKNAMLRKALHPKSAIMCLNELQTGLVWDVQALAPVGSFCASVEVNGQMFRGYGNSKSNAKQAASEAALVSFVKPPPPKALPGQNPLDIEDDTPWKCLASFAMYKLFSQWSEGKVGSGMAQSYHQQGGDDVRHYMHAADNSQEDAYGNSNIAMHLHKPAPPSISHNVPKAAKLNPAKGLSEENKRTNHPVMVLNQLVPGIKYDVHEEFSGGSPSFTISTTIEETPFAAEGPSVKKAKFVVAKTILREIFGVENEYQPK